ncbi:hypothetical protein ACFLU6_15105 [Acidobacteriota bacterium]
MKLEIIAKRSPDSGYILTCPRFRNIEAQGSTPSAAVDALQEKISAFIDQEILKAFTDAENRLSQMGGVNGQRVHLPIDFFL